MATPALDATNVVLLDGVVAGEPRRRQLPSGDTVMELDVTTRGAAGTCSVPVAWFDPPAAGAAIEAGTRGRRGRLRPAPLLPRRRCHPEPHRGRRLAVSHDATARATWSVYAPGSSSCSEPAAMVSAPEIAPPRRGCRPWRRRRAASRPPPSPRPRAVPAGTTTPPGRRRRAGLRTRRAPCRRGGSSPSRRDRGGRRPVGTTRGTRRPAPSRAPPRGSARDRRAGPGQPVVTSNGSTTPLPLLSWPGASGTRWVHVSRPTSPSTVRPNCSW